MTWAKVFLCETCFVGIHVCMDVCCVCIKNVYSVVWASMLCYLTFRLLYDCYFALEPYFIMLGITNEKKRRWQKEVTKKEKKKKRNTLTHTHAHPERNFIKLFITFRKKLKVIMCCVHTILHSLSLSLLQRSEASLSSVCLSLFLCLSVRVC